MAVYIFFQFSKKFFYCKICEDFFAINLPSEYDDRCLKLKEKNCTYTLFIKNYYLRIKCKSLFRRDLEIDERWYKYLNYLEII